MWCGFLLQGRSPEQVLGAGACPTARRVTDGAYFPERPVIAAQAPLTALLRIRVELLYIKSSLLLNMATLFPCTNRAVGLTESCLIGQ